MADLDYGDRPSKTVARRIFISAMQRLQAFDSLADFHYVGFGAIQFIDFDLVHRHLGVTKMTSIESDGGLIPRCHFNMPFKGIDLREGTAATVLPTLDWSKKAIIWLDYTQRLRTQELADCENVALVAKAGSVLAFTFNCAPGKDESSRVDDLENAVGGTLVPLGVSGARLGGWGLAATQREIVTQLVNRTLASRGDGCTWQQLLNIRYRDGAPMQMIVGILDHVDIHDQLKRCRFPDMPEIMTGTEALEIEVPVLTARERQAINAKLPGRPPSLAGISPTKIKAYAQAYRWLDSPA